MLIHSVEVDAGPDTFDDVAGRAFELYLADQPRKAIAMADYAATLQPESEYPHRIKAISYRRLRRPKKALASAVSAVALAPDEPLLQSLLADLYLDLNDLPGALKAASAAVRLGPDLAEAHTSMAKVLLVSQKYDEAEVTVNRALELDPTLSEARTTAIEVHRWQQAVGQTFTAMRTIADGGLDDEAACRDLQTMADDFLRGGPAPPPVSGAFDHGKAQLIALFLSFPTQVLTAWHRRSRATLFPPDIRAALAEAANHPTFRRERKQAAIRDLVSFIVAVGAFFVFIRYL